MTDKRVAFVTGASRGIGLEFVRQYTADGARVIGTVRRTEDAAKLRSSRGMGELRRKLGAKPPGRKADHE
jgi:NAD(P)-dependent dehydrogenase (short-subunit alcohol dehydrogenase family)